MSTALVRKSLLIIDPQDDSQKAKKHKSDVFQLANQNQKLYTKGYKKQGKEIKVNLLSANKKLTVTEARKKIKSKEQILKENLRKLDLIKSASKIQLDEKILNKIINRAVTRRPVQLTEGHKEEKTAFTEEDFKKFEEEYFDE